MASLESEITQPSNLLRLYPHEMENYVMMVANNDFIHSTNAID